MERGRRERLIIMLLFAVLFGCLFSCVLGEIEKEEVLLMMILRALLVLGCGCRNGNAAVVTETVES